VLNEGVGCEKTPRLITPLFGEGGKGVFKNALDLFNGMMNAVLNS